MIYLSSYDNVPFYKDAFGFMLSIEQHNRAGIRGGMLWMLDNGVYTGKFSDEKWRGLLVELLPYKNTCLGVVVPDVVADYKATLERFDIYAPLVRDFGYKIAFVTQDGLSIQETPWNDFDVLFIGGSNNHKLGCEARALINEGKKREKWIHVGRVNSVRRMFYFWDCDSCDGTEISINPSRGARLLGRAVREIRNRKQSQLSFI